MKTKLFLSILVSPLLPLLPLLLAACGPSIKYTVVTVPEEGGVRFAKITDVQDAVVVPLITERGDRISYSEMSSFDVSPDGQRMAFVSWKNNKANIYVKELGGGRATLQRTFRESVYDPAFSPDGNTLAYTDFRDGSWNIYTIGARAGSAIQQITTSGLREDLPVFSPEGNRILFVQKEPQTVEGGTIVRSYIWTYGLRTGALTQYGEGTTPSFAPDGRKVAVMRASKETGLGEIWLIDLELGQEFLVLGSREGGFLQPVISPDGQRIAYVSAASAPEVRRNLDVFLVRLDGTGITQLTFHPGHDLSARWSPDGKSIYFLSQRGSEKGEFNIWRMDLR